jgi:hypothetical protein
MLMLMVAARFRKSVSPFLSWAFSNVWSPWSTDTNQINSGTTNPENDPVELKSILQQDKILCSTAP